MCLSVCFYLLLLLLLLFGRLVRILAAVTLRYCNCYYTKVTTVLMVMKKTYCIIIDMSVIVIISTQPHLSHITSHTCDQHTWTVKATLAINTANTEHSSRRVAAHGRRGRRGSLYCGVVVAIVVVVVAVSLLLTFTTQMTHPCHYHTSTNTTTAYRPHIDHHITHINTTSTLPHQSPHLLTLLLLP